MSLSKPRLAKAGSTEWILLWISQNEIFGEKNKKIHPPLFLFFYVDVVPIDLHSFPSLTNNWFK